MRALVAALVVVVGCSSNDVSPRLIAGGGVGDGAIDGEVNVYIIDSRSAAPVAGASVAIGETEKTSDARGLVVFADVSGAQTIAVKAEGYRSTVWVKVNGANVTMPVEPLLSTPAQATLQGTIASWSNITPAQGHYKAAIVLYSQTDDLGDNANSLVTPLKANICAGINECAWSVVTRTGTVTLTAVLLDGDSKGTLDNADDTLSVTGYAVTQNIMVSRGVNQSGLVLQQVEAGNLETVTIDEGTPPAGLTEVSSFPGIETGHHEVVQLPLAVFGKSTSYLTPKRSVYGADATYRLTAIAGTSAGDKAAQSIILRQGLTDPALETGTWLVPPANVAATRTTASYSPVSGARAHSAVWRDATGADLLEITVFDAKTQELDVPNGVALPPSGTLTARVNAIGADFDPNDFSLEDDSALLWGIAAQPTEIP